MIVETGNILIYLPPQPALFAIKTNIDDIETKAFINYYFYNSEGPAEIFLIIAPKNLVTIRQRTLRYLIAKEEFSFNNEGFGLGYWIKERKR